jgi:hypothetical protein
MVSEIEYGELRGRGGVDLNGIFGRTKAGFQTKLPRQDQNRLDEFVLQN